MTIPVNPSPAIFLPENAPFTPEQRSWLNGFFAGLVALNSGAPETALALPGSGVAPAPEDDGDAPWHDQTIALAERMKLAEGRPLRRRMMAAMAQQDCGQCGYNCSDYADVVVRAEGSAPESLRARRQGNRPHAEVSVRGARQRAGGRSCRKDCARCRAGDRRHAGLHRPRPCSFRAGA